MKYSTPVLLKIDLSKISVFSGCNSSGSDDDSCYC